MWNSTNSGQNILEMSPFLKDKRFPEIAEVDAYWSALCAGRSMPSRSEIDPRGIEGALSHTFLLERIAPGIARLRLAGHHLNDLIGMEVRGMPLTTFFAPHHRKTVETLIETVCTGPNKAELHLSAERGIGKPAIEARMKLWPLADAQGYATRLLGALSFQGQIGRAPRCFMVASSRACPLVGSETHPQVRGFAEPGHPFELPERRQEAASAPSRPYLRLVKPE